MLYFPKKDGFETETSSLKRAFEFALFYRFIEYAVNNASRFMYVDIAQIFTMIYFLVMTY